MLGDQALTVWQFNLAKVFWKIWRFKCFDVAFIVMGDWYRLKLLAGKVGLSSQLLFCFQCVDGILWRRKARIISCSLSCYNSLVLVAFLEVYKKRLLSFNIMIPLASDSLSTHNRWSYKHTEIMTIFFLPALTCYYQLSLIIIYELKRSFLFPCVY